MKEAWPEAHPDVIRTTLPYDPEVLGIRVITTKAEFDEAMTYVSGREPTPREQEEIERIGQSFDEDWRVLLLEAYPEAYRLLLGTFQASYAAMLPFVQQQRRKRARDN